MTARTCYSCGRDISLDQPVGRKDVCTGCGRDLRCCRNCRFYDRAVSKQCTEPVAELVRDKEKATFCEYFVFREQGPGGPVAEKEQVRRSLNALFKK